MVFILICPKFPQFSDDTFIGFKKCRILQIIIEHKILHTIKVEYTVPTSECTSNTYFTPCSFHIHVPCKFGFDLVVQSHIPETYRTQSLVNMHQFFHNRYGIKSGPYFHLIISN